LFQNENDRPTTDEILEVLNSVESKSAEGRERLLREENTKLKDRVAELERKLDDSEKRKNKIRKKSS
jgi:hypothetical protein